jgi:short subunit dehydrogenase-like uncharacterized protein
MSKPWLIYGAYGYTGELVAREALRRGHRPRLSGRDEGKLRAMAERLGLEAVPLDLDDGAALVRAVGDVSVVFHAAGPFVRTSEPMIRACLTAGAHYVDITGEIPVFERTFAHDGEAKQRGIVLLSGAGFDVVPTDCLAAHVARRVPGATELEIAFAGLAQPSGGTAKSTFEGALVGGFLRRDGKLVPTPLGKGGRRVRFADRERPVLPIPWGDLATAYRTTGIPNITTYMAVPGRVASMAKAGWAIGAAAAPVARWILGAEPVRRAIERRIERTVKGPDDALRAHARSQIWSRASNGAGQSAEAWLETLDGYTFTAVAGVRAVERILGSNLTGAVTPALAFGPDFVLDVEGTSRYDALPASSSCAAAPN